MTLSLIGSRTSLNSIFPPLTPERARAFAELALSGIDREFPYKPAWLIHSAADSVTPRERHPVFYGCFDWHSAVHSHWLLVRILARFPGETQADQIRDVLDRRFTPEALLAEAEFFESPGAGGFERPYGWAWLLTLVAEIAQLADADPRAARWLPWFEPLETTIADRLAAYLPRLTFPVRSGMHTDTAFALGLGIDYARSRRRSGLLELLEAFVQRAYGSAQRAPWHVEPSGEDFFSPSLNIADLLARVLDREAFAEWLTGYLPELESEGLGSLGEPVAVSDVTDGRLAHLAGLNLSRAWCFARCAAHLPDVDGRREVLVAAARRHGELGGEQVFSGHYAGDHWLATFAVKALSLIHI